MERKICVEEWDGRYRYMIEFNYGIACSKSAGYILTEDEIPLLPKENVYILRKNFPHGRVAIPREIEIFMKEVASDYLTVIDGMLFAVEIIAGEYKLGLVMEHGDIELCRRMGWDI